MATFSLATSAGRFFTGQSPRCVVLQSLAVSLRVNCLILRNSSWMTWKADHQDHLHHTLDRPDQFRQPCRTARGSYSSAAASPPLAATKRTRWATPAQRPAARRAVIRPRRESRRKQKQRRNLRPRLSPNLRLTTATITKADPRRVQRPPIA